MKAAPTALALVPTVALALGLAAYLWTPPPPETREEPVLVLPDSLSLSRKTARPGD